jgi:hypothetical protein
MRFAVCFVSFFVFSFTAISQTKVKLADLKEHIGDSVLVEGPVKNIDSANQAQTFITIGNSNNSLIVVITAAVREKFSVRPEDAYRDKTVRVSGRLLNNNGKMQMILSDPSQIVLVDHK